MFTCVNLVSLPLNFFSYISLSICNVYVAEANKEYFGDDEDCQDGEEIKKEYFGDDEDCQDGEEINSKQLFEHWNLEER